MYFPNEIKKYLNTDRYTASSVGQSGDGVLVFEDGKILKISSDIPRTRREKEKTDWLRGRLPVGESRCYTEEGEKAYYLRTGVSGESLISDRFINDPVLLVRALANAVNMLRTLDHAGCPFLSTDNEGKEFVHGDLCLPNIYAAPDGTVTGFIDLENSGLGDRWYDISWMLWSLSFNLKTDRYHGLLLDMLGLDPRPDQYERYIPEEYR